MSNWKYINTIVEITSQWITLKGENWLDDCKKLHEYWRVERPDSVIVIPLHRKSILLPKKTFRVGIQKSTWDFPGGRLPANMEPNKIVCSIIERELGVSPEKIINYEGINVSGWLVDSSFSSQKLWGFVVYIDDEVELDKSFIGKRIPATIKDINLLINKLDCLQCKSVLMEWYFHKYEC